MSAIFKTILFLCISNVFMTFAWYAHLKNFTTKPFIIAILFSWGIAFFEYLFLVPAIRTGFFTAHLSLVQIKVIQEVITLATFVPFALLYMKQPLSLNFLYAGICLVGAVYFIFK